MNDSDPSPSWTHGDLDPLDQGLAAAFGEPRLARPRRPSVLQTLQARLGSKLGVHVDSPGLDDAPVRVTDEVRALRDPSGRYQLLGEIGRGGMGVVYKGRDQDLGRDVAMKVLKDEYASRPDVLARFVEEAQIGGQLQHPGIVTVYELGRQSGERPYFAMKLVKGETLAAQLARRASPADERRRILGIFEQVCQTMAYAHARRVVHRDLKPANVMIGAFGEVQVVDWGFAKVLAKGVVADEAHAERASVRSVIETARSRPGSGSASVAGSMMGTPAYMPPEQALGDIERVDERSDVFSLGAILCELLSGDPPYREEEGDLIRQAAKADLSGAHERLAKCGADEALVALCEECLAPAQRARPASAGELAQRITAYLTSVEERARMAEIRAAEARLKHRVTLLSVAGGVVVLVLAAGSWIWLDRQARARRTEAGQRVASALSATSGARGRAQSSDMDMSAWATAVASAGQLLALVESDDVDPASRSAAEALAAAVQQESRAAQDEAARRKRDQDMRAQLELARIPADEDARKTTRELRRLDGAYSAAFAQYLGDVSLFETASDAALASLRRGDIEVELAGALDDWGLVRDALETEKDPPDPAGTKRIRELATQLDASDPWRVQLRALLPDAAHEGAQLLALSKQADFASLSAVGCRVLGQALWNAGERAAAIEVLQHARELHPRDFDLCFQLAVHLDLLEPPRMQEALDTYRIAHAIRPEHDEVVHRQLLDLHVLGKHVEGERLARILIAHTPSNSHWPYHLGLALESQGRRDEAIASMRRALELDPKDHQALFELGRLVAEASGNFAEAIGALRQAIELYPKESRYAEELGVLLMDHGDPDEAAVWLKKSIELDPKSVAGHGNLGMLLSRQGKMEEALVCFRKVIELEPGRAHAHCRLGDTLRALGRHEEAIAVYRKQIELDPREAEAFYNLGNALTEVHKVDEASACYRKTIELEPRNALAYCNLGNALSAQGHPEEAIASYNKALELDPQLANAYFCLGSSLADRGDLEGAIAKFRRGLELDPRNAKAQQGLGDWLLGQGKADEAAACFRAAIELEPKDARTRFGLGAALARLQRHAEAVESFRAAQELDPQNPFVPTDLGTSLVVLGRLDEARASFRRALERNADQPLACIGLGDVSILQGHATEAQEHYEHAVALGPGLAWARLKLAAFLLNLSNPEGALPELHAAQELYAKERGPDARQWVETTRTMIGECERSIAQRAAASDVLDGRKAVSSAEWGVAVELGYTQKRFREIIVLTETTLRDAPELVAGRYGAFLPACVAARLALDTANGLDDDERARLRGLARAWMTREAERWSAQVRAGGEDAKAGHELLVHVQTDEDLGSVRGDAIEELPEGERAAWRALWKRIAEGAAL